MANDDLFLVLKSQWFEMIRKGIKLEEYRAITPYWKNRLSNGRKYNTVTFQLGYKSDRRMSFLVASISIGFGKIQWGAQENEKYFIIKLGKRI